MIGIRKARTGGIHPGGGTAGSPLQASAIAPLGQDRRDPPFPSDSGYQRNPRAGAPSTLVVTIASMLPPHMVRDRCQPPAPWGDPRRLWLARSRGRQLRNGDRPPNLSRRQRGCDLRKRGAQDQNRGGASGMPAGLSTGMALPLSISEPTARKRIAGLRGRPRRRKRRSRAVRLVPVND